MEENKLAETIIIKNLPDSFAGKGEMGGYEFKKLKETPYGFIYEVFNQECSTVPFYEVFEKQARQICIDFNKRIYSENEFKYVYPKAKDFGNWAFTCKSKQKAFEYLKRFETNNKEKDDERAI